MTTSHVPHVLLSAYQCSPTIKAVSQIGWQWYKRLAERCPVTLVTHIRNQAVLSQTGAPFEGSDIIYIDTEWLARPLYHWANKLFPYSEHAIFLLSSLDFYVYDWLAVKQLRALQKQGRQWDIVHAVTPVSPKAYTRLHKLKRPILLGPWNGGLKIPAHFEDIMKQDASWIYSLRNLGKALDFLFGSTRHAAALLTATQATLDAIPKRYHSRCIPFLENGVDLDIFTPALWPPPPSATQPLEIVYVGRLLPFKGVPMLLKAIARFRQSHPVKLTLIGEGPLQHDWQALTTELQLNDIVNWYGTACAAEIVQQLHQSHVLCLPSIRESGGAVLLEAMACARPVLSINFGGPGEVIDETVGALIEPDGVDAVIDGLVEQLHDIVQHPKKWQQRGITGRQRAEERYGWEDKIEQAIALYKRFLTTETE